MTISPGAALAAVERTPTAFTFHDRHAWVDAFASDGVVEYPVVVDRIAERRPSPRFYETLIGPRDIAFHRDVRLVVAAAAVHDRDWKSAWPPGWPCAYPPSCATASPTTAES